MPRILYVTESMHNLEQGGGAVRIPEGEYLLEVNKIAPSPESSWEDTAKNPWFSVRTTIVDGPVKNRPYSELLTWADKGQFRVGLFLQALKVARPKQGYGYDYPKFARFAELLTNALQGKQIGVMIADNVRDGRTTSQVVEFYPAENFADRRGSMPVSSGNGTVAAEEAANPLAAFDEALGNLLTEEATV